jgi:hypothetical protein
MISTAMGAILVTLDYFDKIKFEAKMTRTLSLYWALWNQSIVFSGVVSTLYWMLLFKSNEVDVNNILIHMTNSIVLVIDLFFVKHPPRYSNFIYLMIVELIYMAFTVIYPIMGGLDKYDK